MQFLAMHPHRFSLEDSGPQLSVNRGGGINHPGQKGYLLPGVPGFCQNVPGTAGAAAGAAAATAAGAAATALIFTTTHVVAKIAAVTAAAPAVAAAAAPAAAPAAFPAAPGTF